jgi:23S rRNA (adenine2503-C2)-methyltransferase
MKFGGGPIIGAPAMARPGQCHTMHIADIEAQLLALGANPAHRARVLRHWLQALPLSQGRQPLQGFLPKALLEALPQLLQSWNALATVHAREPSGDSSERLLLRLHDGQSVEAVLLPGRDKTAGLCISSQVGCAVGCGFCMTGTLGLIRQLGSAELLAQVAVARTLRPLNKVVFMGMGEPAHNLDAVLDAIQLLGQEGGIGHKNIVFSTVGDERVFQRLGAGVVKPALALSLHTTKPALREQLLPRAPRLSPEWLVDAAEAYARATSYPVQVQWTLLDGVNDGDDEVEGLVRLLGAKHAVLNLIPFNTVPGLPFARPAWEACTALARRLHQRGILTKLRDSAGQDVEGGCGQLRTRLQPAGQPVRVVRAVTRRTAV